jgi:hypothetical protein
MKGVCCNHFASTEVLSADMGYQQIWGYQQILVSADRAVDGRGKNSSKKSIILATR